MGIAGVEETEGDTSSSCSLPNAKIPLCGFLPEQFFPHSVGNAKGGGFKHSLNNEVCPFRHWSRKHAEKGQFYAMRSIKFFLYN